MTSKGEEAVSNVTKELNDIVGGENVYGEPDVLDIYSRDHSFALPIRPQCVVKPTNTESIQALVRWANQTGTGLIPVSSGPPRFRGDTIPSISGTVIVDLSGMKKIININRRNRVAVIEPGVTYTQLQPELAKEGLRLANPLLPRRNKSVVASILEREPMLIPRYQWIMLEPLRTLEVIFGDGELLRTGDVATGGFRKDGSRNRHPSVEADRNRPISGDWSRRRREAWALLPGHR